MHFLQTIYLNFILIINTFSLTRKVLFVLLITKEEFFQRKANFTYHPSSVIRAASPPFADVTSGKLQGKPLLTSPASATNALQPQLPNALLATELLIARLVKARLCL